MTPSSTNANGSTNSKQNTPHSASETRTSHPTTASARNTGVVDISMLGLFRNLFRFSSELEEVYDQFSKWLDDPILETDKGTNTRRTLSPRDIAVVQFAGSLLKRTLSETFAGVPLTEGCANDSEDCRKNRIVLNARSLSLELARQKHRLAAQLVGGLGLIPNLVA